MNELSLKEIVFALVESIDLVNYLLKNHHRRVAIISSKICHALGVQKSVHRRAVLAASLHDVGALYVREREELIHLDVHNPHPHAIRGALLLKEFNYFEEISDIVLHHHRYWDDGKGQFFMGKEVPLESFIVHLADRIDILLDDKKNYFMQVEGIVSEIKKREGTIFDPRCTEVFYNLSTTESFWLSIENEPFDKLLFSVFEDTSDYKTDLKLLERIATLFSNIVDSRSRFTASHSRAVGEVAFELSRLCHLDPETCEKIRIAGLLHDIGKIAIPNEIIEKETTLTDSERQVMKSHAYFTHKILEHLKGLDDICRWASLHHEKHDGSGYPFHIKAKDLSLEIDILSVADVFTALSENRPYREGLTEENILEFLDKEMNHLTDDQIVKTLKDNINYLNEIRRKIQDDSYKSYNENLKKISELTDLLHTKTMEEKLQKSQQLH